jgi:hypothetical protein
MATRDERSYSLSFQYASLDGDKEASNSTVDLVRMTLLFSYQLQLPHVSSLLESDNADVGKVTLYISDLESFSVYDPTTKDESLLVSSDDNGHFLAVMTEIDGKIAVRQTFDSLLGQ